MPSRLLTIGAYGFTGESFLAALAFARADALIDVRMRRGMRGSTHSWANVTRLRRLLEEQGIDYSHAKELAPTTVIRQLQHAQDAAAGVAKRGRSELDNRFVDAYRHLVLKPLDPGVMLHGLQRHGAVPALFCVEANPMACHRSLIAEWLREGVPVVVEHLTP